MEEEFIYTKKKGEQTDSKDSLTELESFVSEELKKPVSSDAVPTEEPKVLNVPKEESGVKIVQNRPEVVSDEDTQITRPKQTIESVLPTEQKVIQKEEPFVVEPVNEVPNVESVNEPKVVPVTEPNFVEPVTEPKVEIVQKESPQVVERVNSQVAEPIEESKPIIQTNSSQKEPVQKTEITDKNVFVENKVEKKQPLEKKDGAEEIVWKDNKEENLDLEEQQEQRMRKPIDYSLERVKTGIIGFDDLISGGFEKESTILISGAVGTGKTLFGLQFLYNGVVEENEPGVMISFEEDRESLYKHAKQFGWDFEKLEKENKFRLIEFKPHQMTKIIEEGGGSIRDMLKEINAKRVVVDSITAYGLLFHDEYARRDKVLEFLNSLKKWEVTSVVISEESPLEIESKVGSIGFITDSIIALYYQHDEEKGIRIHSLEVVKMRGSQHTNKLCAVNFEDNGMRIYPDVEVF